MENLNIYKGEIYPIALQVTASDSNYSNFTITSFEIEIKDITGSNIDVYGEKNIDTINNTVIFNWDTNQYIEGQYIIILWVVIEYNGQESKLCSGNISKVIRPIDIVE